MATPSPTAPPARMHERPGSKPKLVTPVFALIGCSTLAYFLGVGMVLPILPRYVKGPLGEGSFGVGLAVGAFSLSALVLRPLAGRLGDRNGRRLLIVLGSAVVAGSVASFSLAKSLPALVGLRLITGAGEAFFFTGAASAINDLAPEERRGEAVSFFSLALYAGLAAGPLIGETALGGHRFDAVWWIAAGFGALASVLAIRIPDTRPSADDRGRGGRLVHPAALLPGTVLASSVWGFSAFVSFVPLYALQLGLSGSRFVFMTYSAIILTIRSFGAKLPDRLGDRTTSRAALIGSIAGLATMAAWRSPAGLFAGAVIFAVGQALLFPGLMTLAIRSAPPSEMGSVVGTFTAFFDLAYGLGAVTLGAVAAGFGYRGAFLTGSLVATAGLGLSAFSGRLRVR